MRILLRVVILLLVLAVVAIGAIRVVPIRHTAPGPLPDGFKVSVEAGRYAMRAADCIACHSTEEGKPFAGGLAMASPLGTIWSTNITPDKETGIGTYTLDDFRAALRDGIRKDGQHLYPAMPYENYRLLSEEDIQNLYAYFMNEVEPVFQPNKQTTLDFPFDQRWGLRVWNWLALTGPSNFIAPQGADQEIVRGAYLVQAAGHCAACHSPRTAFMTQKGHDQTDAAFLSGGDLGGWIAPDLRGPTSSSAQWPLDEMLLFLQTGRNAHSTAVGEMAQVVGDSLQYLSAADNKAIAAYLKAYSAAPSQPAPSEAAVNTAKMLTAAQPDMPLGPRLYLDNCAGCHFVDGKGASQIFPELDGNSLVVASDPTGLIYTILHGAELPSTQIRPAKLRMPDFGWRLDDAEVAALATFLRTGWSNQAGEVSTEAVARLRQRFSQ